MGFRGSPDQALAMLRGEVNSIGGMSWEAIQTNHQDWLTEKKIRVLYTQGANRMRALPDTPGLLDFAHDERCRSLLGLLGSVPDIGRSLVAEPGIPPERAAALRKAFMATMRDPELIAEIKKRRLDLEPLSGEEVQKMVAASVATPRPLVEQAKRYIGAIAEGVRRHAIADCQISSHAISRRLSRCPADRRAGADQGSQTSCATARSSAR